MTLPLAMAVEVNRIEFEIIKKQGLSSKIVNLLLGMMEKIYRRKDQIMSFILMVLGTRRGEVLKIEWVLLGYK